MCPKCNKHWADMDFSQYPNLNAKHLKIRLGSKKKPKDGESLRCTSCRYEYTTFDIVLAGADYRPSGGIK